MYNPKSGIKRSWAKQIFMVEEATTNKKVSLK
jgi:hypothetical protein